MSLKEAYRLHHFRFWQQKRISVTAPSSPTNKDFILWVDFPFAFPRIHTSRLLQNMVFTCHREPVSGFTDHVIIQKSTGSALVQRCQVTELLSFLSISSPLVTAAPIDTYCNDRSAENERQMWRNGGNTEVSKLLVFGTHDHQADWLIRDTPLFPENPCGLLAIRPCHGWSYIRIPVTDIHWSRPLSVMESKSLIGRGKMPTTNAMTNQRRPQSSGNMAALSSPQSLPAPYSPPVIQSALTQG
ncbi:unnamed protein product [Ranitomeya imitator]|uniref:Uncharacterized protein n=1 Tax=Ranitomeya imitator TaxID=111125 RepID=A0ABN9M6L2_9NEOB|nr:unnamed protein product [Ranitomeya imitator]